MVLERGSNYSARARVPGDVAPNSIPHFPQTTFIFFYSLKILDAVGDGLKCKI